MKKPITQARLLELQGQGAKVMVSKLPEPPAKPVPDTTIKSMTEALLNSNSAIVNAIDRLALSAVSTAWSSIDIKVHSIARDKNNDMTGLEMKATKSFG